MSANTRYRAVQTIGAYQVLHIIGDIHGQYSALVQLLRRLGCDPDGRWSEGHRVIFVGDLVDRGPDSPAVIRLVKRLISMGVADCVLGNHDMKLIVDDKPSASAQNHWFFGESDGAQTPVESDDLRQDIRSFLSGLPIALEDDFVRIVHAYWHQESIDKARETNVSSARELWLDGQREALARAQRILPSGLPLSFQQERLNSKKPALSEHDYTKFAAYEREKDRHIGAILMSGIERGVAEFFPTKGKWRFNKRVSWWNEYSDKKPVVFGHYWRTLSPASGQGSSPPPGADWFGPRRSCFCVDYSAAYIGNPGTALASWSYNVDHSTSWTLTTVAHASG
jgi:hypothetical protein